MKKTSTNFLLFVFFAFTSVNANAQSICMVSADFQTGDRYMVFWEEIADVSQIDSVFIYRNVVAGGPFDKVGAVDVTTTSQTYFVDNTCNSRVPTKYAISYLMNNGTESSRSLWHQASVLDYDETASGKILWTKYKKENQVDESYIFGYECFMDPSGLGNFESMAVMMNSQTNWIDQEYMNHPPCVYVIEVSLPDCNVITKSNINTSRSNIKSQQSNASIDNGGGSAGISSLKGVKYAIGPNPATDVLTITFEKTLIGDAWISSLEGQEVCKKLIDGTSVEFDINELSSGVYFVNVEFEGVVTSEKFIKK